MRKLLLCCLGMLMMLHSAASAADALTNADEAAPDYANEESWSRIATSPDKPVDVFFMHPTTYGTLDFGYNAPIDDPGIRAETDGTVQAQASVFEKSCNIFAPRYRQVSMAVLSMDQKTQDQRLGIAMGDMLRAFTYYLEHYNNGRPFILAGHSQGSNVTKLFLRKYRDMIPDDKLVAAYLIGWTFTREDLAQLRLPLAESPDRTGALVTWNTVGKGGVSPTLRPGARCVNPLTWTADAGEAPAALDSYALIELKDGSTVKKEHFTPARINEEGGLEIPAPAIEDQLNMAMGKAVYHRYDYAFFYGNLVENAAARCQAWLKSH